jgi:glyoxylase-like metal-dependent hydrolase (beta-lactamase superfamily II)
MARWNQLRRAIAISALAAAAAFGPWTAPCAAAGAAMVKASAPGYYRMMLGDFEITALSDGTFRMTAGDVLINATPQQVQQALARSYLTDPVDASVNAFLVNTGSKLVLIDTGAGTFFGPTLGKLLANLKASGYQPEQVDEIYITHLHPDHIGGLMSGENLAFPNAILRADQSDADYWLSQQNLVQAASAQAKSSFQDAAASVNPYAKAGHFKSFEGDQELVPGIRSVATHGHTPGHNCYLIESKGRKLLVLGDLIHVGAVQFPDPAIALKYDADVKTAALVRESVFADAADHGTMLAGAHLSFPGLGNLRRQGKGYQWIPVNYSVVR